MAMNLVEFYAKNNNLVKTVTKWHLLKFGNLIKWKNQASVMEFGHGDGGNFRESLLPHFPPYVKECVATDISESMVEYARKNQVHPSLKYYQLDIATKKVPDEFLNRFDHIFSFFVMHRVKDTKQAFTNMREMLKPGGSIFLTFFKNCPSDDIFKRMAEHPQWRKYEQEMMITTFYDTPNVREKYVEILNETGFANHELFEEDAIYIFSDEEEFDNLFLSINSALPNIPEDKLKIYKKNYLEYAKTGKAVSIREQDDKIMFTVDYTMFITSAFKE
ncbi:hypothetical protein JTB14_016216 [Gonioctena quinquepunctata]|nr:hypothetical protein JTB14_016216 [Gonioctena quinquepunctata]